MSSHEHDVTDRDRTATDRAAAEPRRSGWHPVNVGHLVMGIAFVGLVVVWALVTTDTVDLADDGWVLGVPWLVAGAVGLVATVLRGPRHHEHWRHDDWGHEHRGHHDFAAGWHPGSWHRGSWTGGGPDHDAPGGEADHDDRGDRPSGSMHGWH